MIESQSANVEIRQQITFDTLLQGVINMTRAEMDNPRVTPPRTLRDAVTGANRALYDISMNYGDMSLGLTQRLTVKLLLNLIALMDLQEEEN